MPLLLFLGISKMNGVGVKFTKCIQTFVELLRHQQNSLIHIPSLCQFIAFPKYCIIKAYNHIF